MSTAPQDSPATDNVSEASNWWKDHGAVVDAKFISLLIAEEARKAYRGPDRRSAATVSLAPEDAILAHHQARRQGVPFQEHARRLFHEAVMAEEERITG